MLLPLTIIIPPITTAKNITLAITSFFTDNSLAFPSYFLGSYLFLSSSSLLICAFFSF
jgi:hypothetical protein